MPTTTETSRTGAKLFFRRIAVGLTLLALVVPPGDRRSAYGETDGESVVSPLSPDESL